MPFYSDNLIEEVREKNDIVSVISEYVPLKRSGSNYFGICPFHNEKSPSFSVNPAGQFYHCFGCGAGGNVFTFLMEYENTSFPEAVEQLGRRVGMEIKEAQLSPEQRAKADFKKRLFDVNRLAARFYYAQLMGPSGSFAREYFLNRGLSSSTIKKFGLGYSLKYSDALYRYLKKEGFEDSFLKESGLFLFHEKNGVSDKFFHRAMFPIMDVNSRVIGFGGRVFGDGKPKYLNSPETMIFDKSRNLYGLSLAKRSKRKELVLCEGYMDVIALHQAGFDHAVASLGTSFTPGQAMLLKRYTSEILLCYDSDEAGIKAVRRAIPILRENGLRGKVVSLAPYKDPDELIRAKGAEEFERRLQTAENSFLFETDCQKKQYRFEDPEEKTAFFQEVAKLLLGFEDELERTTYLEAVAERYRISAENLKQLVVSMAVRYDSGSRPGNPNERELQNIPRKKRKEAQDADPARKMLLAWLIREPKLYSSIRTLIRAEDFGEGLCRRAAERFFEQLKEGGVNPAKLISSFEQEEEHRFVAELCSIEAGSYENEKEKQKAWEETVLRVKQLSLREAAAKLDPLDISGLQQMINERKALEHLHISL